MNDLEYRGQLGDRSGRTFVLVHAPCATDHEGRLLPRLGSALEGDPVVPERPEIANIRD